MTRTHWIEAARFLLQRYESFFDPDRCEFVPPNEEDRTETSRRFELFTRLCLLILPLNRADASTGVGGHSVATFLNRSFERYFRPDSQDWVGELSSGPSPYQLVQFSGLIVAFIHGPDDLWSSLDLSLREAALDVLERCFEHRTNAHNWRFFNVLGAAFLDMNGRKVDESREEAHLLQLLSWYAGDGWYRDGDDFDLYTAWAFQTYAALWSTLPRARKYPGIRDRLLENFQEFIDVYPRFFSRDGSSLLWGRSAAYRFAASAPFSEAFRLSSPALSPGVARRICSGNLLQFLNRADIWDGPVPTMGFYRAFSPIVQRYTRTTSFGWMHKAFGCLALPEDSPFWTAEEEQPIWDGADLRTPVTMTVLDGPGLAVINDEVTGSTTLISGKVRAATDVCYNRLAYRTDNPVEADCDSAAASLSYQAFTSAYRVSSPLRVSRIRYAGVRGGVIYRQQFLGPPQGHHSYGLLIDLADIPIPGGLLRVDRLRASFPCAIWLGGFAVPGHHDLIHARAFLGEAWTLSDPDKTSTVISLAGWQNAKACQRSLTHAEYPDSTTPALFRRVEEDEADRPVLLSTVLTTLAPEKIDVPELVIDSGSNEEPECRVTVRFANGKDVRVDFRQIEARLSE